MNAEAVGENRRMRAAAVQMEPRIGETARNVERSLEMIAAAAAAGAQLVVLPELCNSGYVFASRDEALALAESAVDGPSVQAWADAAGRHGLHIVAGFAERDGDTLYNSAVLLGPAGRIGTYRKNHLWAEEQLFFAPGNLGVPVFTTPIGRIACAICYDIWFPEVFRLAALGGAEVLCVSTNWVPMPEQPAHLPMMANVLAMGGAHSNSLFVVAADRIGTERGQPFLGSSLIVGPTGWPLAGPASVDREEVLTADLDVGDVLARRRLNRFNDLLADRRPSIYGALANR
jgi:predicted amidohydrolase